MAAYLAGRWGVEIVVLTVFDEGGVVPDAPSRVQAYLEEHGIVATYVVRSGVLAGNVNAALREYGCDFVIIGGYGRQPVFELVLGSALNDVLRNAEAPILICR